jgi:hypothetical protein
LWCDFVDRYHYLGYQLPFGAQLRYFIDSGATGQRGLEDGPARWVDRLE